ncbi:6-phosphogluconolactonase [Alteromonas sediminis]|uniref:6-phosphogluconolactonase n=1 Tax=Alteromonas sediminis TaxID=2259342 RepID=A0A3N5ZEE5_9ALTE|nr:6-phosphogluconolactonase [Alteromonas sediminis]RPJ68748.1 6-phosphogluconolactonase [Alteromonas sediminis]
MALIERNFDSAEALNQSFADQIVQQLSDAIEQNGHASLLVSGGRTPLGLFKVLSEQPIAWSKVFVTLVDERWVDETDSASNTRLVKENLLQNHAASARFVEMKTAHDDAYSAQPAVAENLSVIPTPYTVLILGMGEDSHTASLFPCSQEVEQGLSTENQAVCLAVTPTTAPHQRMSLTLNAIASAQNVYLHLTGDKKKQVLKDAMADQSGAIRPIAQVIAKTDVVLYWTP